MLSFKLVKTLKIKYLICLQKKKKRSRLAWVVFAFLSSYNWQCGIRIFSMPWQIVTLLFKLASASNILSLIFSGSWNVSKSFFYVNFFAGVTASRTFLSFHTTTFLIYVSKFAFTKFLWMYVFRKAVVSTFSQSTLSSTLHLCLTQTSLSALFCFFCWTSIFAGLFFNYSYL